VCDSLFVDFPRVCLWLVDGEWWGGGYAVFIALVLVWVRWYVRRQVYVYW